MNKDELSKYLSELSLIYEQLDGPPTDYFPLLADHEVLLTVPHGKALDPLEKYSVEVLAEMVLSALQMFYRILCRLILIRY